MKRYFSLALMLCLLINSSWAQMRDPTKPAIGSDTVVKNTGSSQARFVLQSILIGPMRRIAMINGQLVSTGSKIQGARVLAIDKNHVVLFYSGKKEKIYLFGKHLWKRH